MFSKVFVCWSADEFASEVQLRIQADQADELRRLQQKAEGALLIWKSWQKLHTKVEFHLLLIILLLHICSSQLIMV